METLQQNITVTNVLDMITEFSREDALNMIEECRRYIESRNDLFPLIKKEANIKLESQIGKAKEIAENYYAKRYGGRTDIRSWISATADFGYYSVKVLILSGSPVKLHIVVNYGTGNIQAFGPHDERIKLNIK